MLIRIALTLILLSSILTAQESTKPRAVRASGEATVSAKPDRAEISIGVSTEAPTAAVAASENAKQSQQILETLKAAIGSGGELKTSGYSIGPEYDYRNHGSPKLTGYRANNSVRVTLDNLTLVGKVIDAATQAGANNIGGVSFTLRNDQAVRTQALAEAAAKARESAEAIAKALGLHVVGVLEAQTAEAPIIRPPITAMAQRVMVAGDQPTTPVETGTLDIHATVLVTLAVQ